MTETQAHYEKLLAEHYTWMLGGKFEDLVAEQRSLLETCGIYAPRHDHHAADRSGHLAIDLGCGSGIQSLALAELGYRTVLAVDFSPTLLTELAERCVGFPAVTPVRADICAGLGDVVAPNSVATAVWMGDTLPHLSDISAVERLFQETLGALEPGGMFVVSLRDLSQARTGDDRFILVRADEQKIVTCFLEDDGDRVRVHDLVHGKGSDGSWQLRTSSYPKLRLSPTLVTRLLHCVGFTHTSVRPAPRGAFLVTAKAPATRAST